MSFYFGTRKGVPPKTENLKFIHYEKGETAFNLPANTVRTILFLGFLLMTYKLWFMDSVYTAFPEFLREVMIIIIGFVGGSFLSRVIKLFQDDQDKPNKIIFHGKALLVLLLAILTCSLYVMQYAYSTTFIIIILATNLTIGFYFGTRK